MDQALYQNHLGILREELLVALGCTEPIAIAYAGAKARQLLGVMPEHCRVRCSGNIIKNVKGVIVPNSGGMRGIDVAAKVEIYHLMNQLKQQGIAVMFVSSELPEVLGIADRVIVMCDGQITGEVMARETTQNEILTLATRFENKMAAGQ